MAQGPRSCSSLTAESFTGIWLFHCHIEWHVDSGLIATFVEAPLELQKSLTIPQDHYDACNVGAIPITGNAAANTVNLLDLGGENTPPAPFPDGYVSISLSLSLSFSPSPSLPLLLSLSFSPSPLLSLHIRSQVSQANPATTRSFTVRGKVALAFSILSGLLGIATIVWYGLAEVTKEEYNHVRARIAEAHLADAQYEDKGITTGSEPVAK